MTKQENKQTSVQEENVEIMDVASAYPTAVQAAPVQEGYNVLKNAEGKFVRRAVYEQWSSLHPETKAEKIWLLNILNSGEGDEGGAKGLGDFVGGEIEIADVIFQPYDSLDEDTGEIKDGVLTYIFTPEKVPYVTSSKTVYFTLKKTFQVFGYPHFEGEDTIKVKVLRKPGKEFKYIDLQILG